MSLGRKLRWPSISILTASFSNTQVPFFGVASFQPDTALIKQLKFIEVMININISNGGGYIIEGNDVNGRGAYSDMAKQIKNNGHAFSKRGRPIEGHQLHKMAQFGKHCILIHLTTFFISMTILALYFLRVCFFSQVCLFCSFTSCCISIMMNYIS